MQLFLYLDYKFRFLDSLRLSYVSLLSIDCFRLLILLFVAVFF